MMKSSGFVAAFMSAVLWSGPLSANPEDLELEGDLFEIQESDELTLVLHEESSISLKVKLSYFPEEDHEDFSRKTVVENGQEFEELFYRGKAIEPYQYPGGSYVSRFEIIWDGRKIPVPEMFWNDLYGLSLPSLKMLRKPQNDEEMFAVELRDESLLYPKLSLSSTGGTLLISWIRPED